MISELQKQGMRGCELGIRLLFLPSYPYSFSIKTTQNYTRVAWFDNFAPVVVSTRFLQKTTMHLRIIKPWVNPQRFN